MFVNTDWNSHTGRSMIVAVGVALGGLALRAPIIPISLLEVLAYAPLSIIPLPLDVSIRNPVGMWIYLSVVEGLAAAVVGLAIGRVFQSRRGGLRAAAWTSGIVVALPQILLGLIPFRIH